jgi:predicted dienelactone hydrolase
MGDDGIAAVTWIAIPDDLDYDRCRIAGDDPGRLQVAIHSWSDRRRTDDMKFPGWILVGALLLVAGQAGAVGFQRATVPDPADKPLDIGIWYPSDAPVPSEPNSPFRQALSLDGAVSGSGLPLIVISHGAGGWLGGHADTALALAEAGFVVVAVTHTGNNRDDDSYPASRWMIDRPRHISRVLDYMLSGWSGHDRIDASHIGIFGFSAGAFTGLVSVGGAPDLTKAIAHCAEDPEELACRLGMTSDFDTPAIAALPASVWVHDPRIRAAALAAVGLGFAFDEKGLAPVTVPVQLWAASEDRNVPYLSNTETVRRSLPKPPDFRMVESAGHFAFLPPCNPELETALPKIWATVCVDPPGFDRAAFHRELNSEIVGFFRQQFSTP